MDIIQLAELEAKQIQQQTRVRLENEQAEIEQMRRQLKQSCRRCSCMRSEFEAIQDR